MQNFEKELLVSRIISGTIRLKNYVLRNPSLDDIYISNEVYNEVLESGKAEDGVSEAATIKMAYDYGIWNDEKEGLVNRIPKDIEDFKVKLYELAFKSNERKAIRNLIGQAKEKFHTLLAEKYTYYELSYNYQASLIRNKYLIFCTLYNNNKQVFSNDLDVFWNIADSDLLDKILSEKNSLSISDTTFRELARTDPWRSYWSLKKDSLFGIPVVSYTDEQRSLCTWSSIYDSVYEHPKRPSNEIIEDDDILDGWMILQRREANTNLDESNIVKNEKIRNSEEVYLPADTIEDAMKVDNYNTSQMKNVKKNRFTFLAKVGEVHHTEMPDVKREIGMQLNRMEKDARK